jgi:hypothetical protein
MSAATVSPSGMAVSTRDADCSRLLSAYVDDRVRSRSGECRLRASATARTMLGT